MREISVKAVVISSIFDVVVSAVASGIFVGIMIAAVGASDAAAGGDKAHAAALLAADTGIRNGAYLIGAVVSVLAGYLAARIAKRDEVLHGALSSVLCVLGGAVSIALGHGSFSLAVKLMGLVASPALGALGGQLRKLQTTPRKIAAG